jgi:hypothetical protein
MPIDPSTLAELKAKHTEILPLETKFGDDIVFRLPTFDEYHRFLQEQVDPQYRVSALRTLVYVCAVHPDRDQFDAILRRRPGLFSKLSGPLLEFAGNEDDAVRKK